MTVYPPFKEHTLFQKMILQSILCINKGLTIKGYDPDFQIYRLAYPNGEVRKGFIESLLPAYVHLPGQNNTFYVVSFIRDLRKGDLESCLERTRSFFASIPNDLENKTEKHYQTIFYLLFRLMGQYVDTEVKSAIGRADVVVKMKDAIYVFEFKFDGTPEEALAQIDSKQYAIPYQSDGRRIVKDYITERAANTTHRNNYNYKKNSSINIYTLIIKSLQEAHLLSTRS